MNELRMYVEHLFQGRVLTEENIELKEEIYGNLVARYEDYLAQGLSEEEAMARTKESVPSIDDVLSGGAGTDEPVEAPTTVLPETEPTAVMAAPAVNPETPRGPIPPASAAVPEDPQHQAPKSRVKWPFVLGIVAVVLIAVFGLFEFVIDPWMDYQEDVAEAQVEQQWREQQNQSAQTSQGDSTSGDAATSSNTQSQTQAQTPQFDDPEDQREWEATTALDNEIANNSIDTLKSYTGNGTTKVQLFESLPLGSYVVSSGVEENGDSFSVRYGNVSEDIDGDALDRAIVYDAVAALSVYEDLNTVNITIHEQYDSEYETDIYSFERTMLEQLLSDASGGSITQLNSSLFESGDQWNAVRDLVMRENVYDTATDRAERN